MGSKWREFLIFTKGERTAIAVLSFFMLALVGWKFYLRSLPPGPAEGNMVQIDSMLAETQQLQRSRSEQKSAVSAEKFSFNPNTADLETLLRLGFSKFSANNLIRYRSVIGGFRHPDQIGRIYGVKPDFFEQIRPFILLQESPAKQDAGTPGPNPAQRKAVARTIDISLADSAALESLPGIGAILAARILKYRESLGGFHSLEQLKEVFGIKPETLELLSGKITASEGIFRYLNINTADYRELAAHPYITGKQASLIANYRKQHGSFSSADDLLKIVAIDKAWLEKIKPYIVLSVD